MHRPQGELGAWPQMWAWHMFKAHASSPAAVGQFFYLGSGSDIIYSIVCEWLYQTETSRKSTQPHKHR